MTGAMKRLTRQSCSVPTKGAGTAWISRSNGYLLESQGTLRHFRCLDEGGIGCLLIICGIPSPLKDEDFFVIQGNGTIEGPSADFYGHPGIGGIDGRLNGGVAGGFGPAIAGLSHV